MSDSDVEMVEDKTDTVIIDDSNFDKFVKDGFNFIRNGIKSSNSLPAAENFSYYECFSTFNDIRKKQIKSVVNSMHKIIKQTGIAGNIKTRDVEEKFDLLVGANDFFLDRAEFLINGESGFHKSPAVELIVSQTPKNKILNGSWNKNLNNDKSVSPSQSQAIRLLAAKNVQRPQLTFSDKIDNSYKQWKPNLKYKPNALRPLLSNEEIQNEEFYHPYEFELNSFNPSEKQLKKKA